MFLLNAQRPPGLNQESAFIRTSGFQLATCMAMHVVAVQLIMAGQFLLSLKNGLGPCRLDSKEGDFGLNENRLQSKEMKSWCLPCGQRISGAHLLHASLSVLLGHVQHVMPSSEIS